MLASLIAALVAALLYGIASVMQAIAVRAASTKAPNAVGGKVDPGLVVRMLGQWRFVASMGLDLLGFVAQLVALQRLPLFAVQAMVASNLAVTAVVASRVIGVRLQPREWAAALGVVAGVGLLGSSAGGEGATQVGAIFKLALILAAAGLALIGMAAAKLAEPYRTIALGITAGLGYGVVGIAARVLNGFDPSHLVRDPASYAIIAAGIISFMFYATALEGGSVTTATAVVVLAETVPPAVIGVIFLGDQTRHGLAGLAWLGFSLAVACAVLLARFGEAHQAEDVQLADAVAHGRANSGSAAAGLLSWYPVDLQLFSAITPRELPSGREHRSDKTSLRYRRGGL